MRINVIDTICVIGAGNLGKRHIQSALLAKGIKTVFAVDPSQKALDHLYDIVDKDEIKKTGIELLTYTSISHLPKQIDMAIVATNSLIRYSILEDLLANSELKYCVLEKFLFPQIEEYDKAQNLLTKYGVQTFVNTSRRAFDYYKELKETIDNSARNIITVSAGNLRVGTHAIHFLDLFAFLLDDPKDISVDLSGLDSVIYDSKRDGYVEMEGSIIFRSGRSTMLFQTFDKQGMPLQLSIESPTSRYLIHENNHIAQSSQAINKWEWKTTKFDKPMQSQLTYRMIDQINANGNCDLPEYSTSSSLHQILLKSLLSWMGTIKNESISLCNIT